jgi:hypothetical protein
MSGFFGKLLTIAAVIAIAWFGWRWWQRTIEAAQSKPAAKPQPPQSSPSPPPEKPTKTGRPAVEDLVPCGVCGAYVPSGTVHCDRRAA